MLDRNAEVQFLCSLLSLEYAERFTNRHDLKTDTCTELLLQFTKNIKDHILFTKLRSNKAT